MIGSPCGGEGEGRETISVGGGNGERRRKKCDSQGDESGGNREADTADVEPGIRDEQRESEHREEEEEYSGSDDADNVGCLAALFGEPHNNHGQAGKPYTYKWPPAIQSPTATATTTTTTTASISGREKTPPRSLEIHVPSSDVDLMAHMVWESCIILTNWIATSHPLLGGCISGTPSLLTGSPAFATTEIGTREIDISAVAASGAAATSVSTINNDDDNGRVCMKDANYGNIMNESAKDKGEGCLVLELGSGTALPAIAALFAGASGVVTTDYPQECILEVMRGNIQRNVHDLSLRSRIKVAGHCWGTDPAPLLRLAKELRSGAGKRGKGRDATTKRDDDGEDKDGEKKKKNGVGEENEVVRGGDEEEERGEGKGRSVDEVEGYDVIIMADTLWLGGQHEALLSSCKALLRPSRDRDEMEKENVVGGDSVENESRRPYPRVIFSFQNHVDNAPAFIALASSPKWGFKCRELAKVGWGGRKWPEDFDEDDEEAYGPVNIWEMTIPPRTLSPRTTG